MEVNPRLTSPKEVRALLEQLGHRPNKGLGQNFLIDANILDIIANTADIQPEESVLEIGPGLGALTERIIPKAKSVTCIEKDATMVTYLKSRFTDFTLIESDAMDVNLDALFAGGITKVAANLPYSVASRLMVDIFSSNPAEVVGGGRVTHGRCDCETSKTWASARRCWPRRS